MIVQVVAGEVGERGDLEIDGADSALLKRVRRHLHRDMGDVGIAKIRQQRLHRDRIGRGALAFVQLAMHAGAQGADRRGTMTEQGQRLCQQLHARGLAIGAGDADHAHRLAGAFMEARRDLADLLMQAVDPQQRHIECRVIFRRGRLRQHYLGAALHGAGREFDAMALAAAQGEEGIAATHPARIEAEAGHDHVRRSGCRCHLRVGNPQQQLVEVAGAHGVPSSIGASSIGASLGGRLPARPPAACNGPPTYQRPILSGGTSSRRSAPPITRENTGAETMPP